LTLIEPALLKDTDFHNNAEIAKKAANNNNNSPYSPMMRRLFEKYQQVVEQYQIPAEEVAKVIVNAAVSDNSSKDIL
jgi:hypothetical protein